LGEQSGGGGVAGKELQPVEIRIGIGNDLRGVGRRFGIEVGIDEQKKIIGAGQTLIRWPVK
jgi:hypothetical protein